MKSGPKRTETWGLVPCPPQRECGVCAALEDKPETMRQARDAYVKGIPTWVLARQFRLSNQGLRGHAWFHNWVRRRSFNLPDARYLLTQLALLRARDTWNFCDANSATRALELLIKLAQAPATEERKPGRTWEEL